jgi:hypothetical protein
VIVAVTEGTKLCTLTGGASTGEAASIHWRMLTIAAARSVLMGLTVTRQVGADITGERLCLCGQQDMEAR